MNKEFLPKEVQSPLWQRAGIVLAVLFFGFFVTMNVGRQIALW